ncbi:FecR family protein [Neolewinella agarilytica]|uniref:FecR family protein n=1 Tax=Neolewinella agarilytica TaxID=478744 RepID=A0A1H9AQF2_9BACT|nr:FecR family protein [Neolewinella agarilytica]SEP78889.1 FecR family protein [Neolewinella agarilytica]
MEPSFQDETLLARWLSGELSPAEEKALRERPDFADYERIAQLSSQLRAPDYDARAELARLKARRATAAKTRTLPLRQRPHYRWAWYAAAAVTLLLAAWFLLPKAGDHYEETGKHLLADGSSVQLNASSKLSFLEGETRAATLSGEAFFEVEKKDVPFVVTTELGTVTVLGTSFNVYERGQEMRVACQTGKVSVQFSGQSMAHPLTAGESVSLLPDGTVANNRSTREETLDWLNGHSYFQNRPLSEIFAEFERQYQVTFNLPPAFDDTELASSRFTNDNLEKALVELFAPLNFEPNLVGNRVIVE